MTGVDRFGLAVGAALAAPLAALLAAVLGGGLLGPAPLAGAAVALLAGVSAGSLRPAAAVAVGGSELRGGLVAVPLAGVVLAVALDLAGVVPGAGAAGWALLPTAAFGAVAAVAAGNAHSRAERDDPRLEWVAAPPPTVRRRRRLALAGAGLAVVVLALGGSLVDGAFGPLAGVGVALVAAGIRAGRYRRFTAHESGLGTRAGAGYARTLVPWERFDGYRLTDDAVLVERSAPWLPPVRCDRADLDTDAVTAVLAASTGGGRD